MRDLGERDEIRELHAGRPGVGHHVERLMGERENAEAYGGDTGAVDGQLAGFGYEPRSRREAAAARKRRAEERKAADEKAAAKAEPPKGRTAPQSRQQKT